MQEFILIFYLIFGTNRNALERQSCLGERGSHDYRVTGFKVDWGCCNRDKKRLGYIYA
jgi:hypothetical protein